MPYKISGAILLQFLIIFLSYAQPGVIRGSVLDGQSQRPLQYASVYINQTTIGTYSNAQGEFELSGLPPGEYDLIVSHVGYQPYQQQFSLNEGTQFNLTIRLKAQANLKEVQVFAKRDATWEKQLKKFTKLFLGTSSNATLCKILNPWTLSFQETENGIFAAHATEKLEIENLSLGYRISYELKNFAVSQSNYLVGGYVRFQELETIDSLLLKQWGKKRKEAYLGSARHLFNALGESYTEEEGFELYEDRSGLKEVTRDARFLANLDKTIFIYPIQDKISPGEKPYAYSVQLPTRLEVHYKNKNTNSKVYMDMPYPVSWIEVKGGRLSVSNDGIVLNPLKMTISGAMFDARIADLLPNDFQVEREMRIYQNPLEKKPLSKLAYLSERPYLHTDKSYYYPNEVIWFKGYINYFSPLLRDSLSHVLYVDLLNSRGETQLTRGLSNQ